MDWLYTFYIAFLYVSAALSFALSLLLWRRRSAPGAAPIALILLAISECTLTIALESSSTGLGAKLFWNKFQYMGIALIPAAWLTFVLQYTGQNSWLTPRNYFLLSIEPFILVLLAWTNDWHHLLWEPVQVSLITSSGMVAENFNPGFWIHAGYSYLLLLLGILLLLRASQNSNQGYRWQFLIVILAGALPSVANLADISGLKSLLQFDLTTVAFSITGLLLAWGLQRYGLFDLIPVARSALVDGMVDGVVVLDLSNRIADLNRAASKTLGRLATELIWQPAIQVFSAWPGFPVSAFEVTVKASSEDVVYREEIALGEGEAERFYDLRILTLKDQHGRLTGRLISWSDITERKQTQVALQLGEERYRQSVEKSPNPIFSVDRQGVIQTWNQACEKNFQYGQEILRQRYSQLLARPQDRLALDAMLEKVFEQKFSLNGLDASYRCKDGTIRFMISRLYPVLDRNGDVEACVFANTDISDRKWAEAALRRQLEELTVLNAVVTACAEVTGENELIERITQIIGHTLFTDNFGILLVDEAAGVLRFHPSYRGLPEEFKQQPIPLGQGITGQIAVTGVPRRISEVSDRQEYQSLDAPYCSELTVPVKIGERIIAVVNAESDHLQAFSEADERLLITVAGQLATAIERLRAEAAKRQRVEELLAITRVSREITSMLDLQQVLNSIASHAAELSNSDASGLFVYRPDGCFHLVAAYGVGAGFIESVNAQGVPLEGSAVGKAVIERRPVQIPDLLDYPEYPVSYLAGLEQIRAILALPMMKGDEVTGGVVLWHRQPRRFTAEEELFLQALSQQSVNAVENARLFEAECEQRRLAEVLRETGTALSTTLDFNTVLDRLLDQVARLMPYDAAAVMLVDGDRVFNARTWGIEQFGESVSTEVASRSFDIFGTSNLLELVHSRQPLVIPDITVYPGWVSGGITGYVHSWIGVPVIAQDAVIAIFALYKVELDFYSPEHAERLSIFAGQAGLAMQNARLFEETRRRAIHQETLNAIIAAAVSAPDLLSLLQAVLDLMLTALGLERGAIWVLGQSVILGMPEEIGRETSNLIPHTQPDIGRTLAIDDWQQVAHDHSTAVLKNYMLGYGLRALLTVPVEVEGRRIGGLGLASNGPRKWLAEEITLVETAGRQLGSAVERLNLLAKTQEQARQVQQIMNTVPEGVLLLDADRRVVLANPAAWQALKVLIAGFDPQDPIFNLAGWPVESLLKDYPDQSWQEVDTGDISPRVFEVAARRLERVAQKDGWVLVLREVTQERENQVRIQIQDRLATVGQLAAGIAHDFNNIMAAITVYTDLLMMDSGLGSTSNERLEIIQQQVERATSLIRQILDFSRRSVMEQSDLDLLPFIKELDKLLGRVLPENIRLKLTYQPGLYQVKADPTRLQQVFMNLALNARDAMPTGGTLHFELEHCSIQPHDLPPFPGLTPGEWISIQVSDTGIGIPAEVLPYLFDPFFTTKPVGQGTGLGLAQVYGIIKQHGGSIDVISRVGEGSTFILYLPALVLPKVEDQPPTPVQIMMGSGETVLVVEDDRAARDALRAMLEMQNYRVLDASNGVEALGIYEKEVQSIILVVSDVVMPEMGGMALYQALLERQPQIKMLFITGHPMDGKNQALLEGGRVHWLQKPFSIQEFSRTLRTLLLDDSAWNQP